MNLKAFFKAIFEEGDCVWINDSVKGCPKAINIDDIDYQFYEKEAETEAGYYFVIHAAAEEGIKRDGNNNIGFES